MVDLIETDTALESHDADADRFCEIHKRAMRRFEECAMPTQPNREESLGARRFITVTGAQWEGLFGEQFDNAIKLEVDKVGRGVQKIERDYRENRIVPDFRPDGPMADQRTADMLDGLHRADSYRFKSQQARDNAAFEAIAGGFGAYRLANELDDPSDKNNDHQRINPGLLIADADQCVFFDIGAKLYDKSDGRYAFIRTSYTREAFEDHFDDCATDFPDGAPVRIRDWFRPDTVTVAEYYEREDVDDALWIMTHPLSGEERRVWSSEIEDGFLAEMKKDGWKCKRQKRQRCRVHKYVLSGAEVLEDCGLIAGDQIPIVPVYGRRYFVDGVERWEGYVQDKMDSQRLYNSCVSRMMELNSLAPREVPIFDPEQMTPDISDQWARANIDRLPFLLAHSLRDNEGNVVASGPIGKVQPPNLPPVLATLVQMAGNDLMEDMQDADEAKANTSAEAMDIAAMRIDAKSGIYLDNIRASTQREGEIYLGMAKEIYTEEGREVETMDEDGGDGRATLMQAFTDEKTGEHMTINDLTNARYKVIASVTEATATRRDKTVKAMLNIAQVAQTAGNQELANAAVLTAVMNIDGEGSDSMIEFARKQAVQMGLEEPNEEEKRAQAELAQNSQPDPIAQVAEAQAADFAASAKKKGAETVKVLAEVEETKSSTALNQAKTVDILHPANDQPGKVPAPIPDLGLPRFLRG